MHERGMLEYIDHPDLGRIIVPTSPLRYHGADKVATTPSPKVGQHNDKVYGEWLGLTPEELAGLVQRLGSVDGNLQRELELAIDIHDALGGHLGGVHFELTGENVSECIGGARGLTSADLGRAYRTQVDPRLNYEQALELALRLTKKIGPRA